VGDVDEDSVSLMVASDTHDAMLLFTNRGKVYHLRAYQIPEGGRTAKGVPLASLLPLVADERVTAAVSVSSFADARYADARYVFLVTRRGVGKRVALREFESVRPSGIVALRLADGDELGWACLTKGHDELILVSQQGLALRLSEQDVRPMGRTARGVRLMRLGSGDRLALAEVVEADGKLFLVTQRGFGRCTPLSEFRTQHRGGKGVRAYRVSKTTGPVVDGCVVRREDEVTMISRDGVMLRVEVSRVPEMGRYTRGVRVMALREADHVASVARLRDDADATMAIEESPAEPARESE